MNGVVTSINPLYVRPSGWDEDEDYSWDEVKEQRKAITLRPGKLGITVNNDSGSVEKITDRGGQASLAGVKTGWRIDQIGQEPWDIELLAQKVAGDATYVVTFVAGQEEACSLNCTLAANSNTPWREKCTWNQCSTCEQCKVDSVSAAGGATEQTFTAPASSFQAHGVMRFARDRELVSHLPPMAASSPAVMVPT